MEWALLSLTSCRRDQFSSKVEHQQLVEFDCLSSLCRAKRLVKAYILPQRENGRLTRPQWQQLRSVLEWAGPTQETRVRTV